MVDRVVSTKLSEEDLAKLADACKKHQCTTSKLIKLAITKWIESENVKKDDLPLQLKVMPADTTPKEKPAVAESKKTSVDEAYFEYFRNRIDGG